MSNGDHGVEGIGVCLIILIITNGIFWINVDSKGNVLGFSDHNLNFKLLGLLYLVLLEITFLLFILLKKKKLSESWADYTVKYKLLSGLIASSLFWLIVPISFFIALVIKEIISQWSKIKDSFISTGLIVLFAFGAASILILFFYLNYLLANKLGKEKVRKFKPGQRVKVKSISFGHSNYESLSKFREKKVTINKYVTKDEIKIKEDKGKNTWTEDMFE